MSKLRFESPIHRAIVGDDCIVPPPSNQRFVVGDDCIVPPPSNQRFVVGDDCIVPALRAASVIPRGNASGASLLRPPSSEVARLSRSVTISVGDTRDDAIVPYAHQAAGTMQSSPTPGRYLVPVGSRQLSPANFRLPESLPTGVLCYGPALPI